MNETMSTGKSQPLEIQGFYKALDLHDKEMEKRKSKSFYATQCKYKVL